MGNFTFKKLSGRLCALAMVLFAAVGVSASEADFYFYASMEALPTGKGKVYVDTAEVAPQPGDYQEKQELKFIGHVLDEGTPDAYLNAWVQPADGYLFAGWSGDGETLSTYDGDLTADLTLTAKTAKAETPIDLPQYYPREPDSTYYAMFARVVTRYVPGEEGLGKIAVSKVLNDTGDEISLTATPNTANCRFAYWTDSEGNRIEDNPLNLTVSGPETYTAHFDCDSTVRLTFPEEGGYIPWSSPRAFYLGGEVGDMYACVVFGDSVSDGQVNLLEYGFSANANQGYLLYGKGEVTISYYDDSYAAFLEDDLLLSSGAEGVNIESLDTEGKSYFLWQDGKFVRATEGFVEPWSAYLMVPDTCGVTKDVLSVYGSYTTGIGDVKADVKAPAKVQGVYDLAGRRLMAPGKDGIYIIDGKKVLYRKK